MLKPNIHRRNRRRRDSSRESIKSNEFLEILDKKSNEFYHKMNVKWSMFLRSFVLKKAMNFLRQINKNWQSFLLTGFVVTPMHKGGSI